MNCITREDMKFGEYFVPARTKARVINKPQYRDAGVPALQLYLAIKLFDIHPKKMIGVPISETRINNELEEIHFGDAKSQMVGIEVYMHGDKVFLDAGDEFYDDATLGKWKLENIIGENIPESIEKRKYSSDYLLASVVEHLENEFAQWVQNNCDFHILDEDDIENGEGFDGAYPGDEMLSPTGIAQFEEKQLEYQKKLETSGFTYEFKGGLIWD